MSLLTDDCDLNDNSLQTHFGENGDYYITIWYKDDNGLNQNKTVRVSMSGGIANTEVKLAVSKLHWAMEESGYNEPPQ